MAFTKSQEACTISKSGLEYLCGLIRDINGLDTNLIDDLNIKSNGTFSSVRINTLLTALKTDCNDYTDSLVSNISRLELKIVTDEADIVDSNILYLYKPTGQTSYNQYVVIEGSKVLLGTTDINMTDYYTITQVDNKFVLKTDYNDLVNTVNTINDTIGTETLTTTSKTVIGAINELDSKSTIETLTKAEYDQKVADGTIDNDVYYIISDDTENLDLNQFNIKTYTSLEQLGLTAPVTVGELFNSMPNNSIARIPTTIEETVIISDVPYPYGILLIDKSYSDRFDIEFKKSHGGVSVDGTKWIGQLKGVDGTGLTWSRVITSKVADVDWTRVNPTSVLLRGDIKYRVKNGYCTLVLNDIISSTMSTNNQIIATGLPKPESLFAETWFPIGVNVDSVSAPIQNLLLRINSDGSMVNYFGTNDVAYFGVISYPVAES